MWLISVDTNNLDFYGIKHGDKLHFIVAGTNLTLSTPITRGTQNDGCQCACY